MRTALTLLLLAAAVPGLAQVGNTSFVSGARGRETVERSERPFRYKGNGHAYFATGVCVHRYIYAGAGGGAEAFFWRGFAAGVDASYHQFVSDFGYGLVSPTISYHFTDRGRPRRIDPFVRYSPPGLVLTGNSVGLTMGAGGGLNYWFKPKLGLRTEFSFDVMTEGEALFTFRIGVNFR